MSNFFKHKKRLPESPPAVPGSKGAKAPEQPPLAESVAPSPLPTWSYSLGSTGEEGTGSGGNRVTGGETRSQAQTRVSGPSTQCSLGSPALARVTFPREQPRT